MLYRFAYIEGHRRVTCIQEPHFLSQDICFHAGDACKHWVRYSEAMETRGQWAKKLVSEFQSKIEKLYEETDTAFARTPLSPFKRKAGNGI